MTQKPEESYCTYYLEFPEPELKTELGSCVITQGGTDDMFPIFARANLPRLLKIVSCWCNVPNDLYTCSTPHEQEEHLIGCFKFLLELKGSITSLQAVTHETRLLGAYDQEGKLMFGQHITLKYLGVTDLRRDS